MESRNPFETELIERIDWLIRLRWFAVLGTGAALAVAWFLYPDELPLVPLLAITAFIGLYNAQFLFHARTLRLGHSGIPRVRQATQSACIQIALDLFALAALVHFSGGVENPMVLFFVFHTIIASILLSRRVSFMMATLAALLFASVVALEYYGVLTHYHLPILGVELYREGPFLLAIVGTMALTLWLVAYLTSSISVKLRDRDRELVESSQSILAKSRELELANARLRKVDAERTRFMLLVTHELRAPISTVHTCVEVALARQTSPEAVRDILQRIKRRTGELCELIGDLLRLARTREEASRDEQVGAVEPAEVLNGVVELMRTEAHSKDLFLSVDIDPDLAPVQANHERLKLVWTNLLSNAIKYTEPGGIVAVALKRADEHLVATVRDTGIGIPPEDQDRIFEEFYRASNARTTCPVGTGVGLAIVQRIVENYGGRIWVESEPGLGSKFTFILPWSNS
ncbi:MAG: HAMP domain-containing sensor histidine kinase [Anaerolineae bacterium]